MTKMRDTIDLIEGFMLLENRIEIMRGKYEERLGDYVRKWFENSPTQELPDDFPEMNPDWATRGPDWSNAGPAAFRYILSYDPSPNKQNTQWMIELVLRDIMPLEDLYKAREYITAFEKFKQRLPVEQRNLNTYRSLQELFAVVKPFMETKTKGEENRDYDAKMRAKSVVYMDTSEYSVISPRTKEASQYFGRNTQWCTAARERNAFKSYTSSGSNLYIILHKPTNRRWQILVPGDQFMDENDSPVSLEAFRREHPDLEPFFDRLMDEVVESEMAKWKAVEEFADDYTAYTYHDFDMDVLLIRQPKDWRSFKRQNFQGPFKLTQFEYMGKNGVTTYDVWPLNDEETNNKLLALLNRQRYKGGSADLVRRGIVWDEKTMRYGRAEETLPVVMREGNSRVWVMRNEHHNGYNTDVTTYELYDGSEKVWSFELVPPGRNSPASRNNQGYTILRPRGYDMKAGKPIYEPGYDDFIIKMALYIRQHHHQYYPIKYFPEELNEKFAKLGFYPAPK